MLEEGPVLRRQERLNQDRRVLLIGELDAAVAGEQVDRLPR